MINPAFSLRGDFSALQVEQPVSLALRAAEATADGSVVATDAVRAAIDV